MKARDHAILERVELAKLELADIGSAIVQHKCRLYLERVKKALGYLMDIQEMVEGP